MVVLAVIVFILILCAIELHHRHVERSRDARRRVHDERVRRLEDRNRV